MDKIDQWLGRVDKELKQHSSKQDSNKGSADSHSKKDFSGKQTSKGSSQGSEASDQKKSDQNKGHKKPHKNFRNSSGNQNRDNRSQDNKSQDNKPHRKNRKTSDHRSKQHSGKNSEKSYNQKSGNQSGSKSNKKDQFKKTPPPTPIVPGKLKVIPLGGLNEVGKNMMAFEYEDDIIIVDMGFEFPSEDLLGIDYIIPDVSYLERNKNRIRGVLITHGHLDHIGGIPYILPKLNFPPLYSLRLTTGLIKKRLEEFKQDRTAKVHEVKPDEPIRLGKFLCKFIRLAHSVPDASGVLIESPIGKIFHTGDFKFDENPAGLQEKADLSKLEELGRQNILALFSDSTNSMKPGHTMSEKEVGTALEQIIANAPGRLVIASFSSVIGRIQQILEYAEKHGRKVFVSGKSMRDNIRIASELGYVRYSGNNLQDIKKYKNEPDDKTLILTTGSQGESFSALTKIAMGTHSHIKVKKGDTIVLSSSPIVGNGAAISKVINNLCIQGAEVIHNQLADVHTSGHAKRDELKKMIDFVKPKYFLPVHGEYYMRQAHAKLAHTECGIPEENIIMLENGNVLLGEKDRVYKSKETVDTKYILIDGSGEGQADSPVLLDRAVMSQNGALVVLVYISKKSRKIQKSPDVISRGFMYMHESDEITDEIIKTAEDSYRKLHKQNPGANRKDIKRYIKQSIDKYTDKTLSRRPLIIPVIVEN